MPEVCNVPGAPWWVSILLNLCILVVNFHQNTKMNDMADQYLKVKRTLQQAMTELEKNK